MNMLSGLQYIWSPRFHPMDRVRSSPWVQLYSSLSQRRHRQLWQLWFLLLVTAILEVMSLGAVLPFFSALAQADQILRLPAWQVLYHHLGIASAEDLILILALVFVVISLLANALRWLTLRTQVRLSLAIAADVSSQIFHRALAQPYLFHISRHSSELITDINSNVNNFAFYGLIPLLQLIVNAVIACGLVVGIFLVSWQVSGLSILLLGLSYGVIYVIRRPALEACGYRIANAERQRLQILQDGLGGIRDVLMDQSQLVFEALFDQVERPLRRDQALTITAPMLPRYVVDSVVMTVLALVVVAVSRESGGIARILPLLGALLLGVNRLLPALQQCFGALAAMKGSQASCEALLRALNRPLPKAAVPAEGDWTMAENLCLDAVSFTYPGCDRPALDRVSLTIPRGKLVAFVGTSGGGKSTAADIVLGLLRPQTGSLLLDKRPLPDAAVTVWQRSLAHVPQTIFLRDASIAENIAFGVPAEVIDWEHLRQAAEMAQLMPLLKSAPHGWQTSVGEGGVKLSGGQRQRIGLARALYRKPQLIVLDEATSALDPQTEAEVMAVIRSLRGQVTVLMIAHRLSTLKNFDLIYQFEKGRVIASGNYQSLLQTSESFLRMVQENS